MLNRLLAVLLPAALCGPVLAQPEEWRWQRFAAVAGAGESLARQYLPNQRTFTYVNWRHLDGDAQIDAIVIVKNAKNSCSLPPTRCVAAVLTTANATSAGSLGVLGNFFPTSEPTFVRSRPDGVRLWIAESRNNFVEVALPREARQPWQASSERRTLRQASAEPGTVPLEEDDYTLLDEQRAAVARLRAAGAGAPAGAPFLYAGDTAAPKRDRVAGAIQTVLDRLAAGRPLDHTPTIDFSTCLSTGMESTRAIAQYMARSVAPAERARSVVVCTDELPAGLDAENTQFLSRLWNTRLWVGIMQVTASTAYHPLDQASARSGLPTDYLASFRALADLARYGGIDAEGLVNQIGGLNTVARVVPAGVAAEADRFQAAVVAPARLAFLCTVRDLSALGTEAQMEILKSRVALQADCDKVSTALNAMP